MGASQSKPDAAGRQRVFTSEIPIQFGEPLVEHLNGQLESDSTRATSLEIRIQERVAEELRRMAEQENDMMRQVEERLSTQSSDAATKAIARREEMQRLLQQVRAKAESQPKQVEMEPSTEKAREALVSCLRTYQNRPLDCWQQVEDFKSEVRKLEEKFIARHQV